MRRAWPDVLREMKAVRPMASKALLDTEVDLDGDVLVVEFAPTRRVPMKAASEQDALALLRESVLRVTGANLAVRFQVGRGVVQHEEPSADLPPDPDAAAAPAAGDAAQALIDGLGAEVVDSGRTAAPGEEGGRKK
jgi:hypothetical protein